MDIPAEDINKIKPNPAQNHGFHFQDRDRVCSRYFPSGRDEVNFKDTALHPKVAMKMYVATAINVSLDPPGAGALMSPSKNSRVPADSNRIAMLSNQLMLLKVDFSSLIFIHFSLFHGPP